MSHAPPGPEPTEFRYISDHGRAGAVWMLFVSLLFLFSALLSVVWGIAALAHASWLESGGLPGDSATGWGIVHLCIAAIQGLCGLVVLFSRRIGFVLGIALAVLGIAGHVAVIGAYPLWSVTGIAVYVLIAWVLVVNRPQR